MMLTHPILSQPVLFSAQHPTVLTVESPALFARLAGELVAQAENGEGEFVLSEDYSPIEMHSNTLIFCDYYHFETVEKKLQTPLNNRLKTLTVQEYPAQTAMLLQQINDLFARIEADFALPLEYTPMTDAAALIKQAAFHPALSSQSLGEKLCNILLAVSQLCGIRLFVFLQLKSYLSAAELCLLYDYAAAHDWQLLLVENTAHPPLTAEQNVLLDADLCELRS